MAQEVKAAMPEAVSVHPDGYKMANYAMLGIVLISSKSSGLQNGMVFMLHTTGAHGFSGVARQ